MPAVSVRGVSKKYRLFPKERDRLKEVLSFGRKQYGHDFWALKDINLEVERGTTLGILGRNGAGKSTLLSIISGIRQPTSGTVEVNGRLIPLFGLGALGFNADATGRENILLNGMILGLKRQDILEHFDDIAAFADIGEFMDQPIKNYSSGMRSRLGFAVAINVKPDILILDETFAGGDAAYKQAALQKIHELRDSGMTTLFVSHGRGMVEDLCTEAVLLHQGCVMATGETTEVLDQYQALLSGTPKQRDERRAGGGQTSDDAAVSSSEVSEDSKALVSSIQAQRQRRRARGGRTSDGVLVPEEAPEDLTFQENPDFEGRVARFRSGTGEARIFGVELLDERLRPVKAVASGSIVTVRVYLEYMEAVKDSELIIALHATERQGQPKGQEGQFYGPNLGYVLELYESYKEDPESVDEGTREFFETWSPPRPEANGHAPAVVGELLSASTALKGVPLKEMERGERIVVDFTFEVPLRRGLYSISAGARAGDKDSYLDKVDVATRLRIKRPRDQSRSQGVVRLPTEIKVRTPKGERQGQSA